MTERGKLKTRGIMFDLDGTILDVRSAYLEAAKTAFSTLGEKTVNIALVTEIPKRLEQDQSVGDLLAGIDVRQFLTIYLRTYYRSTIEKARLMPNVSDTLRQLSRKAKLALITRRSISKKEVRKELERFGLDGFFQYVATALDPERPKPSPEALIRCCEELHIQPSDCIVVGDSVVDVRAGKNACIRSVAVLSGIFSREELEKENPDLILENVNQLPDYLE